jgi:hypothetical protein
MDATINLPHVLCTFFASVRIVRDPALLTYSRDFKSNTTFV